MLDNVGFAVKNRRLTCKLEYNYVLTDVMHDILFRVLSKKFIFRYIGFPISFVNFSKLIQKAI